MNRNALSLAIAFVFGAVSRCYVTHIVHAHDTRDVLRAYYPTRLEVTCTPLIDLMLVCVFPELFPPASRGLWRINKV